MLNEEVIIGFLSALIRKLILSGRALNVEYTQLYMCCVIKLVGYLKIYIYLLNMLEKCLYPSCL